MFGADGGPWNGWKTRYCMNGCAAGQLYTGVLLPPGSPEVRCVRLRAHYVPSKMGRARGGKYLAANLLKDEHVNLCVAHTQYILMASF